MNTITLSALIAEYRVSSDRLEAAAGSCNYFLLANMAIDTAAASEKIKLAAERELNRQSEAAEAAMELEATGGTVADEFADPIHIEDNDDDEVPFETLDLEK